MNEVEGCFEGFIYQMTQVILEHLCPLDAKDGVMQKVGERVDVFHFCIAEFIS